MGMPAGNYFSGPESTLAGLTSHHDEEHGLNHSTWPEPLPSDPHTLVPLQPELHEFLFHPQNVDELGIKESFLVQVA